MGAHENLNTLCAQFTQFCHECDTQFASPSHILYRLMYRNHKILSRRARTFHEESHPQHSVMCTLGIYEYGLSLGRFTHHLTQIQLASIIGIQPQSLGATLQALEEDGYIVRLRSAHDKRAYEYHLTQAGQECAKQLLGNEQEFAEHTFSMLSEEEIQQLQSLIRKINRGLRSQDAS